MTETAAGTLAGTSNFFTLGKRRDAAKAKIEQLQEELENWQVDVRLGYDEAKIKVRDLRAEIKTQEQIVSEVARDIGAAEARHKAAEAKRAAEELVVARHTVAALGEKQLDLAAETQRLAVQLGESMRAMQANGSALALAVKTIDPNPLMGRSVDAFRMFGKLDGLSTRIRYAFCNLFDATPTNPRDISGAPPFRFLDISSTLNLLGGEAFRETLVQKEQVAVDAVVDVFPDRVSAERSRRRQDPSGENLHVVEESDGLFRLVAGRRRGPTIAALPDNRPDDRPAA